MSVIAAIFASICFGMYTESWWAGAALFWTLCSLCVALEMIGRKIAPDGDSPLNTVQEQGNEAENGRK